MAETTRDVEDRLETKAEYFGADHDGDMCREAAAEIRRLHDRLEIARRYAREGRRARLERRRIKADLERRDAALREAKVREQATLEALVKAGDAHVEDDYDEAYHLIYWLLTDHYGMEQLPAGPFESARRALATGGDDVNKPPEPTTYDHRFSLDPNEVCGCKLCRATTEPEETP